MSVKALAWAWKAPAGNAKLVLLALADLADDTGYCFPGHEYVANKCEVSQRTVRRMIALLVARRLVTIERRFNSNGSCTSNGYRLAIANHPVKLTGQVVKVARGKWSPAATHPLDTGDRVTTTEPCVYPTTTTTTTPPSGAVSSTQAAGDPGCRSGELCFPSAVSELDRQALAKLVRALNRDQAQEVLDELAGRMASKRVRNPVGYCAALVRSMAVGLFTPGIGAKFADRRNAEQPRQTRLQHTPLAASEAFGASTDRLPAELRAPLERLRSKVFNNREECGWSDDYASGMTSLDRTKFVLAKRQK